MIINFKTQDISLADDLSDLLCQLNSKISSLAKRRLNSSRFGTNDKINEDQYFILVKYKEILIMKAQGSTCLDKFSLDTVISNIKQYLTSGKIQKFKESELDASNGSEGDVIVTYKYNNNITYNVYNSYDYITNNNSINQTIEDTWDETSW